MPAKFQVPLFYNFDNRYWTASVSATAEQVEEIDPIPHYSTVDFNVTFCAGGVATTLTSPDWTGGIKVKDDFSGTYLVQLSNPTLVGTVYTFTMLIDSTELRTALLSPQNQYAFEIHEATSGISTLVPIFFSISRSYTLTGASPSSASGTLVVAATKTVSFPLSLTFPSANGTNGFSLVYGTNGVLSWASSGALTDGNKNDITVSGSAGTWTIDPGVVTLAKMANMATARVIGRTTAGTGVPELLTISGTGSVAMTNTPTLVTPVLGDATATSINGTFIGSSANGTRFVSMAGGVSYINLEGNTSGGYIDTSATVGGPSYSGGYIKTAGGSTSLGGNIDTSGSGANAGGSINTSGGGGSIDTTGNGSIGLGVAANRITLVGTAGSNGKTATLPNVTGTVVVASVISTTLGSGATTLAVASRVVKLTGHVSGNTIGTITGGISGMSLVIIFVDALVTITNDDTSTANTVNLSASFTSSANDTLSLVYDGNKWFETARSVN